MRRTLSLIVLLLCAAPLCASSMFDAQALLPDSQEIGYDDGRVHTWWCSDKDSFGAAVRFTPREYPCEVIGGRAPIHYDMAAQIYVRAFDATGPGGHPGTMLAEAFCSGVPHNADSSFQTDTTSQAQFGLTAAISTSASGRSRTSTWSSPATRT